MQEFSRMEALGGAPCPLSETMTKQRVLKIHSLFRKFVDWVCRSPCEGGGTTQTSFPYSLVFNWPSVEARPLLREAVVSASIIVCDPFSAVVEMEIDQQLEYWINIKFLVKLGKSGSEICQMLQQAYGEDALKWNTVFKWVQYYWEGQKIPRTTKGHGALPLCAVMKT
jgi:hypothetical protein